MQLRIKECSDLRQDLDGGWIVHSKSQGVNMTESKELLSHLHVADIYRGLLTDLVVEWKFRTWVDILVVVDTEIATVPGVEFGIGSVIQLIRSTSVGCMIFRVDIALRNEEPPTVAASPGEFEPRYRGFRFDMQAGGQPVIDKYEQIWCFGFKPSNSGSASDAEIDLPSSFPASNAELAKLAQWMNDRKGGLFGTGDHHFLGASMCRNIPRLGSMRRWTNADRVPPIGTPDRIDTLRPPSPAFEPGAPGGPLDLSNSPHQGDGTPQPIQWVTWQRTPWPIAWKKRPHPVLCHPKLGPINVMPDHAHEGLCIETVDIDPAATFDFDGSGAKPEYPNAVGGGTKPMPAIIAYGSTLGDPPYNFLKGPQPARSSFPMISVYDGHLAGVGRVATDSTWHHWMDVNIADLKAADGNDWKKISRYYINLAVWLNPPGLKTHCLWYTTLISHFDYPGFEEYWPERPAIELGDVLRRHLYKIYGPCWVTERIWWELIWVRKLFPWEILRERDRLFDFGGIDPELIENLFLGNLVRATFNTADAIKKAANSGSKKVELKTTIPDEYFERELESSIKDVLERFEAHYSQTLDLLRSARK